MNSVEYLNRLRLLLRDQNKRIWSDEVMLSALAEGKREYCRRAPLLVGVMPIFPERDGTFRWPDDFCRFLYGINRKQERIFPATARKLVPYAGMEGEPFFLIDSGEFRFYLYPKPDDSFPGFTFVKFEPEYGKMLHDDSDPDYIIRYDAEDNAFIWYDAAFASDTEYGIVRQVEGAWSDVEYGIIREFVMGEPIGQIRYWRFADNEEWILDSMLGSVYYAAAKLLTDETDRKDLESAAVMTQMFERECSEAAHRVIRAARTSPNGSFF